MRTPTHWKDKNLLSLTLTPLGWLYGLASACRLRFNTPQKVNSKVICVGNFTAGGTGKTPVAVSLAKLLQNRGKSPYFITRGYGGRLQDVIVDSQKHSAIDVGDEPLLLARQAPVVVNRERYLGAVKAENNGADFIIMDDGFQNPSLYKDLSLVVIDGTYGLGNELCIPAGPLREFLSSALIRAGAIAIIGEDKFNLSERFKNKTIFRGRIVPQLPAVRSGRVFAFAGIGNPAKFYRSLQETGFELAGTRDFPDHHFYTEAELQDLISIAQLKQALLYTTAKDIVKIPARLWPHFRVLEIAIEWEAPDGLCDWMLHH